MPGPQKYDWPRLKLRYLKGEFLTFRQMAEALQIPFRTLKTRAIDDGWLAERNALVERAEEQAKARILMRLGAEAEKRLVLILETADLLREKGTQALKAQKKMGATNAIRALQVAVDIEVDLFSGKSRGFENRAKYEGGPLQDQGETPRTVDELREEVQRKMARLADAGQAPKDP